MICNAEIGRIRGCRAAFHPAPPTPRRLCVARQDYAKDSAPTRTTRADRQQSIRSRHRSKVGREQHGSKCRCGARISRGTRPQRAPDAIRGTATWKVTAKPDRSRYDGQRLPVAIGERPGLHHVSRRLTDDRKAGASKTPMQHSKSLTSERRQNGMYPQPKSFRSGELREKIQPDRLKANFPMSSELDRKLKHIAWFGGTASPARTGDPQIHNLDFSVCTHR